MSCSVSGYCIFNTGTVYDNNYTSGGTYNGNLYYTGETNGYVIYYSSGSSQWCLATSLGSDCVLFGKSPCVSTCPDLCDSFLTSGPCPSPTPSPTPNNCLTFDFTAVMDCEFIPTPTPTPTPSITPTMTPTPSTSPLCSIIGVDAIITGVTPTMTPTMTPTPSNSATIIRPCEFTSGVTFNVIDTIVGCPSSKVFMSCSNGDLFYTMNYVETPSGDTLTKDMVFNATVNGNSACIKYMGIDETKSGVDNITLITGPLENDCLSCESTTTTTSTSTSTTTSTTQPPCNCYQIASIDIASFEYTDCSGNTQTISLNPSNNEGYDTICSRTTPVNILESNNPHIVEQFGVCLFNSCTQPPTCGCYSITNNSYSISLSYWYYDCNYNLITGNLLPRKTSVKFCSLTTPYVDGSNNFSINYFGTCIENNCIPSNYDCNILRNLQLLPNNYLNTSSVSWSATTSGSISGQLTMEVFASWYCTGGTPLTCTRVVTFNGGGGISSISQPTCPWSTGSSVMQITGNANSGTVAFGVSPSGNFCTLTDVNYLLVTFYYTCPNGFQFSVTSYFGQNNT